MAPKSPKGETRGQVFSFVKQRLLQGEPPTVREVQHAFSFKAVQTAREHLENLVKEGRLVKTTGKARGYRLPADIELPAMTPVPVLGRVQAGALTEAIEDPEGYIGVDADGGTAELFALSVQGCSMKDAGILPGDLVVVKRQPTAAEGDIVVAMIGDEATVKRLRFKNGHPQLHPENDEFSPIIPAEGQEIILLGKVIEVRRIIA
jgi:repressor LexA